MVPLILYTVFQVVSYIHIDQIQCDVAPANLYLGYLGHCDTTQSDQHQHICNTVVWHQVSIIPHIWDIVVQSQRRNAVVRHKLSTIL